MKSFQVCLKIIPAIRKLRLAFASKEYSWATHIGKMDSDTFPVAWTCWSTRTKTVERLRTWIYNLYNLRNLYLIYGGPWSFDTYTHILNNCWQKIVHESWDAGPEAWCRSYIDGRSFALHIVIPFVTVMTPDSWKTQTIWPNPPKKWSHICFGRKITVIGDH